MQSVSERKPSGEQSLHSATPHAQNDHSHHQTIRQEFIYVIFAQSHSSYRKLYGYTEPPVEQQEAEMWSEVGLQCAHTHSVGHALLIGLLCQKFSSGTDSGSQVWYYRRCM